MTAMPMPVAIDRLELGIAPYSWPFAQARREEIDAHFAARRLAVPDLWNGRVLLMKDVAVAGGTLRDWDFPDRSIVNCFAMGRCAAATAPICSV